jgi:hypothetical protein
MSRIPAAKVARLSVEKINQVGLQAVLNKLNGRDLLLEAAGKLKQTVVEELIDVVSSPSCSAVILLTDTPEKIAELRDRAPLLFALPETDDDWFDLEEIATEPEPESESTEEELPVSEQKQEIERNPEETVSEESGKSEESQEAAENIDEAASEKDEEPMTLQAFNEFLHQYALDNDCKFDSMAELALAARLDRMEMTGTVLTKKLGQEMMDRAIDKADRWSLKALFVSRYDNEGYLLLKEKHFS